MGRARDIANVLTTVQNIDVSSSLDSRIFISSASPTSGNTDGRIWIDTTTASAPVLQTYGAGEFRTPGLTRIKALGGTTGFANIYWQGSENKSNLMVIDLLGPSLEDLYAICGKKFSLKTTLILADQIVIFLTIQIQRI
jgi:hypothetical protein